MLSCFLLPYLQQTLGILRVPGGDDLETGDGTVPGSKALRVLGSDTGGSTVGATEGDGAVDVTARHVVGLGSRVDDLINGLFVNTKIKWVSILCAIL